MNNDFDTLKNSGEDSVQQMVQLLSSCQRLLFYMEKSIIGDAGVCVTWHFDFKRWSYVIDI